MKPTTTFNWFRKIAFAEGLSFLVLLFIAMPLKYFADRPMAVRIIGGLHGLLFVALLIIALLAMSTYRKNFLWFVKVFIASIMPFGTFWMDHTQWKSEEAAIREASK